MPFIFAEFIIHENRPKQENCFLLPKISRNLNLCVIDEPSATIIKGYRKWIRRGRINNDNDLLVLPTKQLVYCLKKHCSG